MKRLLLIILLCTSLSGCALKLLNVATPDGYQLLEDIHYGEHPRQRLDLALPDGRPKALIVFFYGGGWTDGRRQDFRFVLGSFTNAGYAVALPDYRLFPEVRFPAFVEDGARAMAWLSDNAKAHGLEGLPVVLMGHSAGAHIAAMLNFDDRYLKAVGVERAGIAALVGISGPYDFLPLTSPLLKDIFAPESQYPISQPVNFVDGDEAPALLMHGDEDTTAWTRNTIRMAARIREQGGRVETVYLAGIGHRKPALALSSTFKGIAPVVTLSLDFIERQLDPS